MKEVNGIGPTKRQQFWLEHLMRCRESGQSLKAYAQANGLSVGTFYSYSKQYKGKASSGFARVEPTPRATAAPLLCRVALPNGVTVELGINGESLGAVLGMAAKLP